MKIKDKILLFILGLLTIGIYPAVIFLKKPMIENKELKISNKITIDISMLYKAIGGKENIIGTEFTHTKVKIFIKDNSKIDSEGVNNIKGVSGVFATSKYVTIIVGNQAANLAKEL